MAPENFLSFFSFFKIFYVVAFYVPQLYPSLYGETVNYIRSTCLSLSLKFLRSMVYQNLLQSINFDKLGRSEPRTLSKEITLRITHLSLDGKDKPHELDIGSTVKDSTWIPIQTLFVLSPEVVVKFQCTRGSRVLSASCDEQI